MARARRTQYRSGHIRPTPYGTWRAELCTGGVQRRKSFKTRQQAEQWIEAEERAAAILHRPLTPGEQADAAAAIRLLPEGASLQDAARALAEAAGAGIRPTPISDAVQEYLSVARTRGLRVRTLQQYRHHLERLARDVSGMVHDLTSADLARWLDSIGAAGRTRTHYIGSVSAWLTWSAGVGYCRGNAAGGVPRARMDAAEPGIWRPEHVGALLEALRTHRPDLLPYHALGFFAGLRPQECHRVPWEAIGPEHIYVSPAVAKRGRAGYVTVQPALRAWIEPHPGEGLVCPVGISGVRRARAALIEATKLPPWPPNCCRHSFASYHEAMWQDSARTAHELRQFGQAVFARHYRAAVTREQAEAFWALRPVSK